MQAKEQAKSAAAGQAGGGGRSTWAVSDEILRTQRPGISAAEDVDAFETDYMAARGAYGTTLFSVDTGQSLNMPERHAVANPAIRPGACDKFLTGLIHVQMAKIRPKPREPAYC